MGDFKFNHGRIGYFGLTDSIIEMIDGTRIWIKACNLLFDDEKVKEALKRALNRGVALFILTNLEGATGGSLRNKKYGKKKKEVQTTQAYSHVKTLGDLSDEGAYVSGLDGLHAKFLLTDTGKGVVTSVNFTYNSTSKITEMGLFIDGKEFDELEEVFDYLFLRPDRFKFEKTDDYYNYETVGQSIDSDQLPRGSNLRLNLGPTARGGGKALENAHRFDLRDEIFSIINSAKPGEELYIATYSLIPDAKDQNGKSLARALIEAHKRGVKIFLLKRSEKEEDEKDHKKNKKKKSFLPDGLKMFLHDDNHGKAVVSQSRGIIFTGNLTPESFESGFDIGVVLDGDQIDETRNFIKEIIKETIL